MARPSSPNPRLLAGAAAIGLALLACFTVTSCKLRSLPESGLNEDTEGATVEADSALTTDLLIAKIQEVEAQFQREGKVLTRNAFLKYLPERYRRRYTILQESNASEYVDYNDPLDTRILGFGDDAKVTIAWVKNSNQIQIAEHKISHFELRQIKFPEVAGEEVHVSKVNPSTCAGASCHGDQNDPHFRWDPYPKWIEAMAGNNDFVPPNSKEHEDLKKFYAERDSIPAYADLIDPTQFKNVLGTFRIGAPPSETGARTASEDNFYEKEVTGLSYQYRPNTFLTLAYSRMHSEQLFHHLKASKLYSKYELPLAYLLTRCQTLDQTSTNSLNQTISTDFKALGHAGIAPHIDNLDARYWMPWFELLGISPDRWTLNIFAPDLVAGLRQDHLYNEGFTSLVYFVAARIWENMIADDSSWDPLYLKGTLRDVEDRYFAKVKYMDEEALHQQVAKLDALGRFLNVENRPYLIKSRPQNYDEIHSKACTRLGTEVKAQFGLR